MLHAQDTFSIVAVDPATGEVGSAGASCLDLNNFNFPNNDFISNLIPGIGAINTQASYLATNQNLATQLLNLGFTPTQMITYLTANDAQNTPQFRQYGIAAFINGQPQTAAFTGTNTLNYKNHIIGPYYTIQGNILLGQVVLDNMETAFLNATGSLACRLMAALQGAKMAGADTRCTANGTSSLFAYVSVAKPTDLFGSPSFRQSVRTTAGAGIEPITALQTQFDLVKSCTTLKQQGTVGINTTTPASTMDVVAKNTDLAVVDGVIAPRLTGNELKAKDAVYLAAQTGALVYATAAASPTTSKTINVKAAGYYYFDGTVWIRIAAPAEAPAAEAVGTVKSITNLIGTTTQIVAAGSTVDVAGLSQTIIVPEVELNLPVACYLKILVLCTTN
jgi:uncharacterized Ntn-hydrolase superfamily protein